MKYIAQGLVIGCEGTSDVIEFKGTITSMDDVFSDEVNSGKAHAYFMDIGVDEDSAYSLTYKHDAFQIKKCVNWHDVYGDVDIWWYGPDGLVIEYITSCYEATGDITVSTQGAGRYMIVLSNNSACLSGACEYELRFDDVQTEETVNSPVMFWGLYNGDMILFMLLVVMIVFSIINVCIICKWRFREKKGKKIEIFE